MEYEQLRQHFHGITGISLTPFKKDGKFDEAGYSKHLKFLIKNGINKENAVLVITGSTGECGALKAEERKYILNMVLETVKDEIPIIAGCNSTGYGRLPVIDFTEEEMEKIKNIFSKMGLI